MTTLDEMARDLLLKIAPGPKCPACGTEGFDDWHLEKTIRRRIGLVDLEGSLKCHGCGKFFSVTAYHDGPTHSTMWCRARSGSLSPAP